jgi:hypothetical protein
MVRKMPAPIFPDKRAVLATRLCRDAHALRDESRELVGDAWRLLRQAIALRVETQRLIARRSKVVGLWTRASGTN